MLGYPVDVSFILYPFQILGEVSWSDYRGGGDNNINSLILGGWVTNVLKNGEKNRTGGVFD